MPTGPTAAARAFARLRVGTYDGVWGIRVAPVLGAAAILGAAAACSDATDPSVEPIRADSAGIEVVRTPAPLWAEPSAWYVEEQPLLSIGLTEGEEPYLFGSIAGVLRLEDGGIVVADGQTHSVRFFDSEGRFLREVGGQGEGPGEFRSIRELWLCGEGRIYVDDRMRRRVSVWTPEGELVRGFQLLEPGAESRSPYRVRCAETGELVVAGWGDTQAHVDPGESRLLRQSSPVWVLDSVARPVMDLGEHVISERAVLFDPQTGSGGSSPHPLGRAASFALTRDRIYFGTGEGLVVHVYDRRGTLTRAGFRARCDDGRDGRGASAVAPLGAGRLSAHSGGAHPGAPSTRAPPEDVCASATGSSYRDGGPKRPTPESISNPPSQRDA